MAAALFIFKIDVKQDVTELQRENVNGRQQKTLLNYCIMHFNFSKISYDCCHKIYAYGCIKADANILVIRNINL